MKWTKVRYIHLELERQNKCQKVENLLKVERAGIQEFHTHRETATGYYNRQSNSIN